MAGRSINWQFVALGRGGHGRQETGRAPDYRRTPVWRGWIALLMASLLLVSSGAGLTRARGVSGRAGVLVIIGDSLSSGYLLDNPRTQSWPATLVRTHPQLGQLVNLAIPGYGFFNEGVSLDGPNFRTTSQTMLAIAAHPTLIIIWMGINDFHKGYSVGDVTHHLDQMLGALAVTHARIFVINYMNTMAWGSPINHDDLFLNQTMLPILAYHHATLIDMFQQTHAIWENPLDIQQHSPPHPTVKGSAAIAQVVYVALHHAGLL